LLTQFQTWLETWATKVFDFARDVAWEAVRYVLYAIFPHDFARRIEHDVRTAFDVMIRGILGPAVLPTALPQQPALPTGIVEGAGDRLKDSLARTVAAQKVADPSIIKSDF